MDSKLAEYLQRNVQSKSQEHERLALAQLLPDGEVCLSTTFTVTGLIGVTLVYAGNLKQDEYLLNKADFRGLGDILTD